MLYLLLDSILVVKVSFRVNEQYSIDNLGGDLMRFNSYIC